MTTNIPRKINRIKNIAKEYYLLEKGVLIERHTELLRAFSIRVTTHKDHPHGMKKVYISRRALKHYVESRKEELSKNHSQKDILDMICFGIDMIQETINNFDSYKYMPPEHFYIKDFSPKGRPFLRIIVDLIDDHLEIKSIHFRKNNK